MVKRARPRIPVNLIAGPLGVGKTTAMNHLLERRPHGERWAVLVNEYGLVGLDAALLESAADGQPREGVLVREVAGGCICCSAGLMFDVSLVLLLRQRPDRLLIEPTGLAALSRVLDTLNRLGIRKAVDVRSIVWLFDPARFREDRGHGIRVAPHSSASRSACSQELFGCGGSMSHPVSTSPSSFVRGGSKMRPPCGSSGSCIERNTSAAAS